MKCQELKNGDTYKRGDISYGDEYIFITLSGGVIYLKISSLGFIWGSDFGENFSCCDIFKTFRKVEEK